MIATEELYKLYLQYPEVCTDSRHVTAGSLFFALRGANFDGNQYAASALAGGAAYAIVDNPDYVTGERTLLVEDVLASLQALARHHRRTLGKPVIAITGTNGKTTTKELTAAVLTRSYDLLYTEGNLNNHIGVPLTLLRLRSHHQLALIEMGASHPGDIAELCAIAEPNYGLITNIGKAHLEGFGSIEGVRRTKGELYDWLRAHGGIVFYRAEDDVLCKMSEGIQRISYGTDASALLCGSLLPHVTGTPFLSFSWSYQRPAAAPADSPATSSGGECQISAPAAPAPHEVRTKLVGDYNLANALAAIAIGVYFDVPSEAIDTALSEYTPTNSRSQYIHSPLGNDLVADAYNANPSSMLTAVDNFTAIPPLDRPRVLILGDMNELGEASQVAHHELLEHLLSVQRVSLTLYLCGPCWKRECADRTDASIHVTACVEELIEHFQRTPLRDSLILVKGSNGIHLGKLLPYL